MPKPAQLQTERILFSQIDFEDHQYLFAPPQVLLDIDDLTSSIERVGLLHPPILLKKEDTYYQIITGHSRLRAAEKCSNKSSVTCLLPPPDVSATDSFAIALEEICSSRPMTVIEQAIFLQKALENIDEKEVVAKFLPVMGLEPSRYHIKNLLPLLQLEEPLAYALHRGFLSELVARELVALPFTDRLALFETIDLLQLSFSNQKKLTAACRELARRDNSSIIAVLSSPDIESILNHQEANPPQKTSNLMAVLTAKRYPRLTEAEDAFRRFTDSLKLPQNVAISHAPAFEKDTLTLTVSFKDKDTLIRKWEAIKSAME